MKRLLHFLTSLLLALALAAPLRAEKTINDYPAVVPASGDKLLLWDVSTSTTGTLTLSGLQTFLGSASGTVTSVAMTVPNWLTIAGTPITTSGTLAVTATGGLAGNRFLATPDGLAGALSPRAIVNTDLPADLSLTSFTGNTVTADTLITTAGGVVGIKDAGGFSLGLTSTNSGGTLLANGTAVLTASGARIGTPTTMSGAGAVPITAPNVALTTTGGAQAVTLANGTNGQEITILHDVDGGSAVLTPATKTGFSTVTFTNVGETVTLKYLTTRGWFITGSYGVTIAP